MSIRILLPWFGTDAMSNDTDRIVPVPYEWGAGRDATQ